MAPINSKSPRGPKITRRTFVAGAGITALSPSCAFAQAPPSLEFKQAGQLYVLKRGDTELWVLDPQWFDAATFKISAKSKRLSVSGYLAGSNVAFQLLVNIDDDTLGFSSFGGVQRSVSSEEWVRRGVEIELQPNKNKAGRINLRQSGRFRAILTAPFNLAAPGDFQFSSAEAGTGKATGFYAIASTKWDEVEPEIDQLIPGSRPLSRLTLDGVTVDSVRGWSLGSLKGRILRLFFGQGRGKLSLDQVSNGARAQILRRSGSSVGAPGTRLRYGEDDFGRDLHLAAVEIFQILDTPATKDALKISRSMEPAYIEANNYAAAVKVSRDCFFPGFREKSKKQIALPVELFVFHARGDDQTRFDVDFRAVRNDASGLALGEPGLNRSAPIWNTEGTSGVPAVLSLGLRVDNHSGNWLHLGDDDSAHVMLHRPQAVGIAVDSPVLRLRRSLDGLDLGLLFFNFRLEVNKTSHLVPLPGAQRGVRFNPQHHEEECFSDKSDGSSFIERLKRFYSSTSLMSTPFRPLGSAKDSTWFPGGPSTLIARTRAAGDSRVIFAPEIELKQYPLTAEALTAWGKLDLSVAERALGEDPIDVQLAKVGIVEATSREEAKQLIRDTLKQPEPHQTAMELVTGLFFSPDKSARLRTTHPNGKHPALWTAQLDLQPAPIGSDMPANSVVRAIWASELHPDFLFGGPGTPLNPEPFIASTTRQNRFEIALQSSVFGLAGLRSVTKQGVDIPNSRVRRVADKWKFVDTTTAELPDSNGMKAVQEGVFSPAPFKQFTARLTGFGADLDAEWQAEPLVPYSESTKGEFFEYRFAVERYVHRTRLGSDAFAEVVLKGYLFPYGFRVSLIRTTQREPSVLPEYGAMMPLITRFFIVPKPVTKTFPGIYQPFDARGIPLRSARLLSERSPELDGDAMDPPAGLKLPPIPGKSDMRERVFWPTLKSGKRLDFDFAADGLETGRTLPMLFVSNGDANIPESVRKIIDYYNGLGEEYRREDHHRGMTVYAVPKIDQTDGGAPAHGESGSTSFETDHIVLQARPRAKLQAGASQDAPYSVDAFMSGVDEPPFYPIMAEASIVVPPLDRIMGQPQGFKRVGFNTTYLRNGFDQSENRAELYLDFYDVEKMPLGDNASLTGFVQPRSYLASISRINALVGAQPKRPQARTFAPGFQDDLPTGSDSPWNFDTIQKGFNPRDFFKNAYLFEAISLEGVTVAGAIKDQPQLKQVFEYDLNDGGARKALHEACVRAAALIGTALDEADKRLKAVFAATVDGGTPIDPKDVSIDRFYPDLTAQLRQFKSLLAEDIENAPLPVWISKVVAQWGPVKVSMDAVIANPSPEPLRTGMLEVRKLLDTLQTTFGNALKVAIADGKRQLTEIAIKGLVDAIVSISFDNNGVLQAPWFYEAITGVSPLPNASKDELRESLTTLFNSPKTVGPEIARAMLGRALTQPVLLVLDQAQTIADSAVELGIKALAKAVRATAPLIQRASQAIVEVDILINAARQNASKICAAAGGAFHLEDLLRLLLEFAPGDTDLSNAINTIRSAWPTLDLNGLPDTTEVLAARAKSSQLQGRVSDLEKALQSFAAVRGALAKLKIEDLCKSQPQQLSVLWARFVAAHNLIFPSFYACVLAAEELERAYLALPSNAVTAANDALKQVRRRLIVFVADVTSARLATIDQRLAWLDAVPVVGQRVHEAKSNVIAAGTVLRAQVIAATDASLAQLKQTVETATGLSDLEARLFSQAADFVALASELVSAIEKIRGELLSAIATPMIAVHTLVLEQANQTIAVYTGAPDLVKLFTGKVFARLSQARDQVQKDADALAKLAAASNSTEVAELLERWRTGEFGLVNAVDLIIEFFTAIMTGQIGGVFDLGGVRRAAEEAVRRLIPSKVNTSYTFEAGLKKWEIFEPQGDKKISLTTEISVDLLNPTDRKVEVTGLITPFDLHFMESPNLVTISFDTTKFRFEGLVPKFETKVTKVTPGTALGYFSKLSEVLQIDANIYAEPTTQHEGIRVGYRYSKDVLELGGVQVLNFGFDASLALYLDGTPAEARMKVAERAAPCGIVVAPCYYGAGYFSLQATPQHITAFEIQLEFGAARALKFGPLKGSAAVSAGMYLMSARSSGTRLEGFVHAVGEGSIACFGVGVNFEVKVVHDEDAKVTGSASYRFSFRVGLASVGYGVTASYGFSGQSKKAEVVNPMAVKPEYCSLLPDKTKEWLCYRDHFVTDWPT